MMVAHDKMLAGDLKALDRTLKVIESRPSRGRSAGRRWGRRARL
jgi:hypothetical protein